MKRSWVAWSRHAALALLVLLLGSCGGGGGGGGGNPPPPPLILATVVSFPTGAVPPGFSQPGTNSLVAVSVLDASTGASLSNASVSVNGVPLAYNAAFQEYEAETVVDPAQNISLSVSVNGGVYTASATQFTAYPSISSPQSGATWLSSAANLVAWSSVAPSTSSLYLLGVVDTGGNLVWPSGTSFQSQPSSATSYTIGPSLLSPGDRYVLVGVAALSSISSAASGSAIVLSGFNYVPVTVTSAPPPATLVSIAVTPATPTISVSKSLQLTATGTYSDSSVQDLTAQVTWSSSDTTKVTVSATGLVTGVDYGSATITATLGSVSGSATVNVFQTNPSPVPPLSQAVAYQIDYAHSGFATFGAPLSFPPSPTPTWSSIPLNGAASYPLIVGGKVYVTTSSPGTTGYGTSLYALDEATGNIVWGPVTISGTYYWSGHAYDHGKIFVVNYDGLLRSFDAATGAAGWSTQLPGQIGFSSPPTAVNGIVYVGGAGTLYAVDEANGGVLWTAAVTNGDNSSPAVSSDGVFVSYPCQAYKFDPLSGASLWHYSGGCEGGGGRTPAYANGLVYVRDWTKANGQIFDASNGTEVGSFTAGPIPAFSTQTGFFQNGGTLQAVDLGTKSVLWSFTGDGTLVSAPIVIDGTVIVGSSSGNVYAVDAATGSQLWSGSTGPGTSIAGPDEQNVSQPLTGLGAGEGYLVVPAGNKVTAWHISGP